MKITILGAGAMGGLFASLLSQNNDVTIIDLNTDLVDKINKDGFILNEKGTDEIYHFKAATTSSDIAKQDLVILFVKAMYSKKALDDNKNIIGKDTYLLTMQNGMGHEDLLSQYQSKDHILLGTTQHNASIRALGENIHGGSGPSAFAPLEGDFDKVAFICDIFNQAGISCQVTNDVRKMIWNKLFTNISASVLTGILQKPLGYIRENENAWNICKKLIEECFWVAKADGFEFCLEDKIKEVEKVCLNSPNGLTSVYQDLKNGRKTEVDTISGALVKKANKLGINIPVTTFIVSLIHALEDR